MNEITKIHLGRQAFTISVEAYKTLQAYLHEIKRQVGDKGKDVVDEVELRMAELLAERGIKADKVVLPEDVDYLKEQLGSPRDFKDEDDTAGPKGKEQSDAETTATKRLFRDTNNAWLAGVCAGLGKYFGIDATIIRLIFIALLFFGGGGVLLYVVLWLIVPEARTTSEQLQMQGKPVTVDSLKQVVGRADIEGAAKRASNVVGPVVQMIAKIVLGILGVGFMVIAVALLLGVMMLGMYAWVHHGVSIAGEHFFPTGTKETLLLLCGLVGAGTVGMFFLLGGITMVSRKRKTPGWLPAALGCVFILAAAGGATLLLDRAPVIRDRFNAMHHVSSTTVAPFKSVVLNGKNSRYTFIQDASYKVEYRYLGKTPAVFSKIDKGTNGGTLTLDTGELRDTGCDMFCTYNDYDLSVTIYAPSLENITLNGKNSSFTTSGRVSQDHLHVIAERDASVELPYMFAKQVTVTDRSGESSRQLDITGIDPVSYAGDVIDLTSDNIIVSRTGTLALDTDRVCEQGDELVTALSSIDKIVVNGTEATAKPGGLRALQSSDANSMYDCVTIDPGHVSGGMPPNNHTFIGN
ncbi:MAG TPA: PspC domain-containing protein [Candidatus Saccharimonadales bacterium]|jgi:phage shock protein PspC (stress-responsive transcriptional regulator)|nr:PspC domain-containing protein [Candidatus Saccharimonadales bacterium]